MASFKLSARPALTALLLSAAPLCALGAAPALAQDKGPAKAPAEASGKIPARPEQLEFAPLEFELPERDAYRHVLSNGTVVYLAPSHDLPLVDVTFLFKGGRYLDPVGKEGLASATASLMRRGGAGDHDAKAFDERVDFLAAQMGVGSGDYQISASLNTLTRNLDESFPLFLDMLRRPGFQEDKVALYKSEVLEALKQRNDDADSIIDREWTALVYGSDHFKGRLTTQQSLEAIDVPAMQAYREAVLQPKNLVIGVTGDFQPDAMLARLEKAVAGWEAGEQSIDPPAPGATLRPGVYRVEKDIPQGKVILGMRGIQRDDPDFFALSIMSRILGSGGFTSRITNRVRSEEGLAYSAGAYVVPGLYFPGEFRAFFQSKSRTVALATKIIFEEIERIRSEPVSTEELATAKSSIIESFPTNFGSKQQIVGTFMSDELTGRGPEYWASYRDEIQAVTAEDVLRVAKKHLVPEQMAILVVGEWGDIREGDLNGRATMAEFFEGQVQQLPLRDPLTLEPLPLEGE